MAFATSDAPMIVIVIVGAYNDYDHNESFAGNLTLSACLLTECIRIDGCLIQLFVAICLAIHLVIIFARVQQA